MILAGFLCVRYAVAWSLFLIYATTSQIFNIFTNPQYVCNLAVLRCLPNDKRGAYER